MMARTVARLPSGARISDHVTLGVLTSTVPAALIDTVLADSMPPGRDAAVWA